MTREEAAERLEERCLGRTVVDDEALALAIEALSDPSMDEIREYCRHHYDAEMKHFDDDHCRGKAQGYWNVMRRIEEGP